MPENEYRRLLIVKLCPKAIIVCTLLYFVIGCASAKNRAWVSIDEGFSYAKFRVPMESYPYTADSFITVIRIDPKRYGLRLCTVSELGGENRTVREWARELGLVCAFNAGMYLTDYTTSCGYMKNGTHFNNKRINKTYHSFAAFNPVKAGAAPFRMFDDDVTPADSIIHGYSTVVQNLRLVKRPGVNRWERREKRWSEVALGEDGSGNVLVLFCRIPMSMYEFNERLLSLPIGLQCAQHLEGGSEASLFISHNGTEIMRTGSYGADWSSENSDSLFRSLPNVIGVVKR